MTVITEPLDRVAQSHIEGRVERVRPAAVPACRSPMKPCYHCGAEYDEKIGYYPHAKHCPCNRHGEPQK